MILAYSSENNILHISYMGNFKDGQYDGYGMETFISQALGYYVEYEGEFKKGKRDGDGIEYEIDLKSSADDAYDTYMQTFNKWFDSTGEQTPEGGMTIPAYVQPVKYDGEWDSGSYEGKGTLYWSNGKIRYEGKWKDGSADGKGKSYTEDGVLVYDGEWKKGKYDGKGTLYNSDGSVKYKGKFKNGDTK